MEPQSRYTVVGAGVVVLALLLAGALVWLSAGSTRDFHYYTIHFSRQSLSGLQIGSDVNMRGVKVGRVEHYRITPENINQVDVTIRVGHDTPVRENTSAVVARSLVTGLAWIDLITQGTPGPELVEIPTGAPYPVISEGTSDLDQIADALGRLAVIGQSALENLDRLLGEPNQAAVMETVRSVQSLMASGERSLQTIDDAIGVFARTSDSFSTTALAFGETAQTLTQAGREMSIALTSTMKRIDPMLDDARQTMASISRTARAFEREAGGMAEGLKGEVAGAMLELRLTARELRGSAEALARTAERLREPGSAIFGPSSGQLGPGESR